MTIHLCKTCHADLTEAAMIRQGGNFCAFSCYRQWQKLSLEEARARHYEWVREEARANKIRV